MEDRTQGSLSMSSIEVKNLGISLGLGAASKRILESVAFSVGSGQSFGLIGESGSGKSTVLKCICPSADDVDRRHSIGGVSVRDMPAMDFCRIVQMVFQDPYGSLHPRQSIKTALREPLADSSAWTGWRSEWNRRSSMWA